MLVEERIKCWRNEQLTIEDVALAVSATASIDVKRVGGDSLIAHSSRVNKMVKHIWPEDQVAAIAALLHDTVEDTTVGLDFIRNGFGDAVADVVDILTRRDGERYSDYIERIHTSKNPSALRVKFCDALDNSSHFIASVANDKVAPDTWLYWRVKYRKIAASLLSTLLQDHQDEKGSVAMKKAIYVWAVLIDSDAIKVIRDGKSSTGSSPTEVYRAVLDDENPHRQEDTWYITPWGVPEEVKFAPSRRAGYSGHLAETLAA